jgi:hypothetical protein
MFLHQGGQQITIHIGKGGQEALLRRHGTPMAPPHPKDQQGSVCTKVSDDFSKFDHLVFLRGRIA